MDTKLDSWSSFKYYVLCWKFFGWFPPAKGSRWHWPYLISAFTQNLIVTLFLNISFSMETVLSPNMDAFIKSSFFSVASSSNLLKYVNMFLKRKQFLSAKDLLDQLDTRVQSLEERKVLSTGISSARFWIKFFMIVMLVALFMGQVAVFFSPEPVLSYPLWMPWDWKQHFAISRALEVTSLLVMLVQYVTNECISLAYLRILSAHIQCLALRVAELGQLERKSKATQNENNYAVLCECIKDHKLIIELFELIQKFISNICLVQMICTALSQCSAAVFVVYCSLDLTVIMSIAFVCIGLSLQLFLISYFAENVIRDSENLTVAIYNCNWVDQDLKFRKAMIFFMQRSQKLNTILAGNMVPIGLPTFIRVQRMTYSVYTFVSGARS